MKKSYRKRDPEKECGEIRRSLAAVPSDVEYPCIMCKGEYIECDNNNCKRWRAWFLKAWPAVVGRLRVAGGVDDRDFYNPVSEIPCREEKVEQ